MKLNTVSPKFNEGDVVRFLWPQTGQWYTGIIMDPATGPYRTDDGPQWNYKIISGSGVKFSSVAESRLTLLVAQATPANPHDALDQEQDDLDETYDALRAQAGYW